VDARDLIGERGEAIFRVLMTRKHPKRGYLFEHPRFLGEKKRTIDFHVELFHDESLVPLALVWDEVAAYWVFPPGLFF
jgi:hypothetical protein